VGRHSLESKWWIKKKDEKSGKRRKEIEGGI